MFILNPTSNLLYPKFAICGYGSTNLGALRLGIVITVTMESYCVPAVAKILPHLTPLVIPAVSMVTIAVSTFQSELFIVDLLF